MSDQIRIGDADRDRAAADLAEHYAAGRLSVEEHGERLDAIWTARTARDLAPIFDDLPARSPAPTARPSRRGPPWRRLDLPGPPFLLVVAVLVGLSVLTHLPFWILIFFVGCGLFSRRHRMTHRTTHGMTTR